MNNRILLWLCIVIQLVACSNKEKYIPPYYETNNTEESEYAQVDDLVQYDEDVISVPFTESGGVKYINVELNRTCSVRMILDSGCSGALISIAEANYLYDKGVLTDDDFVGVSRSMIADGSIVENMVINIREVIIGGKIVCPDVEATVSANTQAPLLLGNEILNRSASYMVDNKNKTINFKLN